MLKLDQIRRPPSLKVPIDWKGVRNPTCDCCCCWIVAYSGICSIQSRHLGKDFRAPYFHLSIKSPDLDSTGFPSLWLLFLLLLFGLLSLSSRWNLNVAFCFLVSLSVCVCVFFCSMVGNGCREWRESRNPNTHTHTQTKKKDEGINPPYYFVDISTLLHNGLWWKKNDTFKNKTKNGSRWWWTGMRSNCVALIEVVGLAQREITRGFASYVKLATHIRTYTHNKIIFNCAGNFLQRFPHRESSRMENLYNRF